VKPNGTSRGPSTKDGSTPNNATNYELIGTMGGQRFDANLETSRGHDNASFLVNEQTKGIGASISLN